MVPLSDAANVLVLLTALAAIVSSVDRFPSPGANGVSWLQLPRQRVISI
jgi:hypothetical protein